VLGLPLAIAAQWAGWPDPLVDLAATIAAYLAFFVGGATWWSCILAAGCVGLLAFAVARSTRTTPDPEEMGNLISPRSSAHEGLIGNSDGLERGESRFSGGGVTVS